MSCFSKDIAVRVFPGGELLFAIERILLDQFTPQQNQSWYNDNITSNKTFYSAPGQLFFSRVFRQDIALKCLDILSTLVTSHPQHLHRVFRLLLPFALISKPSSSHVTFARAVVTSLLQHRSVGDFDWSKSAASRNRYNSIMLRHKFYC